MDKSEFSRVTGWGRALIDSLNDKSFVTAVRQGLTLTIPLMILGSLAIFINNLPIAPYQALMFSVFGEGWKDFGGGIYQATFSIMGLCMNFTVSHAIVSGNRVAVARGVSPVVGALVSVMSLFSLVLVEDGRFALDWIGPLGVFVSMITAYLSTSLFLALHGVRALTLRMYGNSADRDLSSVISSLIPSALTLIAFVTLRLALGACGIPNILTAINDWFLRLFEALPSSLFVFFFVIFTHVLWFFGIHGNNVLEPVVRARILPALDINQSLVSQGLAPTQIFTKEFFDVFVFLGGSGATLCLILALFLGTRRANIRKIATFSIFPGLINVNEMMIYGLPIVLNFYLLIPFLLIPPLFTLISYTAMTLRLVPLTVSVVEWTTPIGIGGFITTGGSLAGSFLQFFNLALGTLLYLPFVRAHEYYFRRDNARVLKNLQDRIDRLNEQRGAIVLHSHDSEGSLARALADDLERILKYGAPVPGGDGKTEGNCVGGLVG
ncbi:MAG: PTS transporter subunit EIIC, partial [Clostridiales bacterium]|nr:PTS transporter subunit EIIC [Clostridiales bacterium]